MSLVIDDDMLDYFRRKTFCELCGKPCPQGCDPDHVQCRGMGGGSRIDTPLNIVHPCRECHNKRHAGLIPRSRLWAIIDARYGLAPGTAQSSVNCLLRRNKAS